MKIAQKQILNAPKNNRGELDVNFAIAIQSQYPQILVTHISPSCWGHTGDAYIEKIEGGLNWKLAVPSGEYKSSNHYHSAFTGLVAIESSRKKLNLPGCPLFLIKTTNYNGDYRSLKKSYYLFGKNEDESFFLHKIRPRVGETGDLDKVRAWMWQLRKKETIAARQGDLAFVRKSRGMGEILEASEITLGNHQISAEQIRKTKHKIYVLDPQAIHNEHYSVKLLGWHEIRLAKSWQGSTGD